MPDKVRIEIHLESKDVKVLDKLAKDNGRSRKNFCETEIRKLIEAAKLKSGRVAHTSALCAERGFENMSLGIDSSARIAQNAL